MGSYNSGTFMGMNEHIRRLKEEADRKAAEEQKEKEEEARRKSLISQWRRDVPVGPPTQAQSQSFSQPEVQSPQPRPVAPTTPKPTFQVGPTQPTVDTSTPSLSNSQVVNQTAQIQTPQVQESEPSQPQQTRQVAPVAPQINQSPQSLWNPSWQPAPRNTGVVQPILPSLLPKVAPQVGKVIGDTLGGLAKDWNDIDWSNIDWRTGLPALKDFLPMQTGQEPFGPAAMAVDILGQQIEQRHQERKYTSVVPRTIGEKTGNVFGTIGEGLMNVIDIAGTGATIALNAPLPNDVTPGMLYSMLRDVGDQMKNSPEASQPGRLSAMFGIPATPESEALLQDTFFGQVGNLFVWTDPNTWNISKVNEYWDASRKKVVSNLVPTKEQLMYNTPQQIKIATDLAIYNSMSGVQAIGDTFDEQLNVAVNSAQLFDKANKLAQMADMTGDENMRLRILNEAGMMGAEAVKLREQTTLQTFNNNFNPWYALPALMIFDPLESLGMVNELVGLTPSARRAAQGIRLAEMPADAIPGSNKTIIDTSKEFFTEWMKTQRSKAMTDAQTTFGVLGNLLTGVSTKGDIATVIKSYLDGTIEAGIALDVLNSPEAALQAANGIMDFGWAGVKDWRAVKAKESFANIVGWIDHIPSLQGEVTEAANKFDVQADLIGLLTRAAAGTKKVGVMGDVPWGATKFEVEALAGNRAVVKYISDAKQVIGQTAEMSLNQANKLQNTLSTSLKTGEEFQRNWVKTVGDFRRNIMSTYTININPSNIVGNAVSGNLTAMMDRGFDMEFFNNLDDGVEYLLKKGGGFFPETRIAEGTGKISGAVQSASQSLVPQGQYDNWFGKLLNASTLGLAKKGREARQGTATLAGGRIKVGEEAMATSIYYAAMKSFFEQEWQRAVEPMMTQLLDGVVSDPQVAKWMTDQIIQAGISGDRVDIAKTFQQIANGKVALSLRSISPVLGDVLKPNQVLELDDMLRNLTTENLPQAMQRVQDVFNERRSSLSMDAAKWQEEITPVFTSVDDAKDVANFVNELQVAAEFSGRNVDEAVQHGEKLKAVQENANQNLLALMQMAQSQPQLSNYIINVWGQLRNAKDDIRALVGRRNQEVVQQFGFLPNGVQGPNQATPAITQAFSDLFDFTNQQWERYGTEAKRILDVARTEIDNGQALAAVQAHMRKVVPGVPSLDPAFPMTDMDALEFVSDLGVDLSTVLEVLKRPISAKDPAFAENLKLFREAADVAQQRMFAMLMRYPTQASFDKFNDAFRAVAYERQKLFGKLKGIQNKLDDPAIQADPAELRKWAKIKSETGKQGWNKWWKYSIERFQVGAYQIAEANFNPAVMDQLNFVREGTGQTWRLVGQDINQPKLWVVADQAGNTTLWPVGKGYIPEEVVDKWKSIRATAETEFWEQVGRIGALAGQTNDSAKVDAALGKLGGDNTPEMLKRVRQRVGEVLANYSNPNTFIPSDLPRYYTEKLNASEQSILQIMTEVAQMNAQGHGKMNLDTISDFNRNLLPVFDNVVTGAKRYAQEMLSLGMVDFTNNYHPDLLLGIFAPYHYWFTRMAKNAMERQLFDPRMGQRIIHPWRAIEAQNRSENQPTRNITKFPGGVQVGEDTFNTGLNIVGRWLPILPTMAMNGWANPTRANRGYDYVREAGNEVGFPGTAKGLAGTALFVHELANQMGLSTYPEYDTFMDWLAGDSIDAKDFQGFLGETSSLHRTLGYGAVRFANWARENDVPLVAQGADAYAYATNPDYVQSLYSREAALQAGQGKLSDTEASMVQDVVRQQVSGVGPMPEQDMIAPEAMEQYRAVQNKTSVEYFIRGLISWLSGAPMAAEYGGETELRDAQATKRRTDYEPSGNTAGSQAAYFSMTDPESENYVQGLAPYEDRYKATLEAAPQTPADSDRPGESVVKSAYFDELEIVNEKYNAEVTKTLEAHPEWSNTTDRAALAARQDFLDGVDERKEAEKKALAAKYPSVALQEGEEFPEPTPWSLYGARPNETMREAQERLLSLAYDNVPKPPDGSPQALWDQWNEDLAAELGRLMNDPTAARDVVFGRSLPTTGDQTIPSTSDVLREEGAGSTTVPQATAAPATRSVAKPAAATAASVDPNNQWATQMSEAEKKYGLPAGILQAVALNESNFDPNAESGAGAMGLMQIMPPTWEEWSPKVGVTDPWNPEDSIQVSAAYLAWLAKQLPEGQRDIDTIMRAYNWGIGNVLNKGADAAPPETKAYSAAIAAAVQGGIITPDEAAAIGMPFGGDHPQTQSFGVNPERYKSWGGHMGLDYSMPIGTPLMATQDATVIATGNSPKGGTPSRPGTGGFGNWVILDLGNGYTAEYAHLDSIDVKPGDKVPAGGVIGLSGHTGVSDFPHLHFGVRRDGEYIDPHDYLNMQAVEMPSTIAPPEEGSDHPPAQEQASPRVAAQPTQPGGIAWESSPDEIIATGRARGKSPALVESDASIDAEFRAVEDRGKKAYPEYAHLYDEYKALTDDQKEAWRNANPMMKAIHMAGYNPDEWATIEKTFGSGAVELWANIPAYVEGDAGKRGDYYRQHPKAFLTKAWIDGRPEPFEDETPDPLKPFVRDFGTDYETAKEMFGADIWNIVEQYYSIVPKYVEGGDNTAWIAWKEENPVFDEWRDWWYALMGNEDSGSGRGFAPWGGFSGGFSSGGFAGPDNMNQVNRVQSRIEDPPAWNRGSSGRGSDWRKYLALGEVNLRNWRR